MGGQLVLLEGRMRDVSSLNRTEALAALQGQMQMNQTLMRVQGRLLEVSVTPKGAWRHLRWEIFRALVIAALAGFALGALAAQAVRWWSFS